MLAYGTCFHYLNWEHAAEGLPVYKKETEPKSENRAQIPKALHERQIDPLEND